MTAPIVRPAALAERLPRVVAGAEVGRAAVDSGHLLIGDPAYFDLKPADYRRDLKAPARELRFPLGHTGRGVVIPTPHGDGIYAVSLEYADDRRHPVRIVIDL